MVCTIPDIFRIPGVPFTEIFVFLFFYKAPDKAPFSTENMESITKTRLYNFDPLTPHFYIVKLGFTGVYISFHYICSKHRLWVLVRTASLRQF